MNEPLILNVDDYDVNRYLRSGVLRKAGYRVIDAPNGTRALELAQTERPDLVVLDVQMPGIDGLEVCRRLRTDPAMASILVLHVSATATGSDALVTGLENGADGYLTDTADPAILVATVRALLRMRRAEVERNEARDRLAETERRLASLVENISDIVYRVRLLPSPAFEYISPSVTAVLGYTPQEHYDDPQLIWKLVHPEDRGLLESMRHDGAARRSLVIRWQARDGGLVWTEHRVVPVLDEQGRVMAVEGVARDVTLQKQVEEELRQANRMKDEFLATLSHELRTPLNAIVGWSQMLMGSQLDEQLTRQAIEAIGRNAMAQRQLINDVLDVSRIVTGKMRLELQDVDLLATLLTAAESLRPAAQAKGVHLKVVPTTPVIVKGDADRLQQVFWNLLSNAVKFTQAGGSVEARMAADARQVRVEVQDTGIGIADWFLPRMFERFSQADRAMNRRFHGLGLGLALVRHLVELHGGEVSASSQGEGTGATLTVILPLAVESRSQEPSVGNAPPPIASPPLRRLSQRHVLIVDDDLDSREVVAAILRSAGARVSEAPSGAAALAFLRQEVPDVIVSDLGMPEQDGYELLREIRKLPADKGGNVPALALSAYGRIEDRQSAVEAGYHTHLTKPVLPDDLVSEVAALSRRRTPKIA